MYLEAAAMLPQIFMFQKQAGDQGGVVEVHLTLKFVLHLFYCLSCVDVIAFFHFVYLMLIPMLMPGNVSSTLYLHKLLQYIL